MGVYIWVCIYGCAYNLCTQFVHTIVCTQFVHTIVCTQFVHTIGAHNCVHTIVCIQLCAHIIDNDLVTFDNVFLTFDNGQSFSVWGHSLGSINLLLVFPITMSLRLSVFLFKKKTVK